MGLLHWGRKPARLGWEVSFSFPSLFTAWRGSARQGLALGLRAGGLTPLSPELPGPEKPEGPPRPIIGPSLATDGVVQPISRQMGLTTLGTLHERVGDAAADVACPNADSTAASDAQRLCSSCHFLTTASVFSMCFSALESE